jgi:acylphosphatase
MHDPNPTPDQIRAHVFVGGKVQGVGYRYATLNAAKRLGVRGWVQNLRDGRVEAVFEGEQEVVEQMIDWCYQGSPAAVVTNVMVEYEDMEGLQEFELRSSY